MNVHTVGKRLTIMYIRFTCIYRKVPVHQLNYYLKNVFYSGTQIQQRAQGLTISPGATCNNKYNNFITYIAQNSLEYMIYMLFTDTIKYKNRIYMCMKN